MSEIVPKLEEKKFKVCIHIHDREIGEWTNNNFAQWVQDSRRTVIFLSNEFLKSFRGMMELKTVPKQMMKDICIRLIIVLYGDIGSIDNLDSKFKRYLRWLPGHNNNNNPRCRPAFKFYLM